MKGIKIEKIRKKNRKLVDIEKRVMYAVEVYSRARPVAPLSETTKDNRERKAELIAEIEILDQLGIKCVRPLKIMDTDLFALLKEQSKERETWLSMPIQVKGSSFKKRGWDVWISKTPMAQFKGVYILLREYEPGKYIFLLLTGDEMRKKKEEGKFHLVWDKKRKAERWTTYINTDLGEWKDHEDRWELVKDIKRAQSIRVDQHIKRTRKRNQEVYHDQHTHEQTR